MEREALTSLMEKSESHKIRKRAHAIILSSKMYKIDQLAGIFDVDRDTVSDWINRWENHGLDGLNDAPRSGRPRSTRKAKSTAEETAQRPNEAGTSGALKAIGQKEVA